MRFQRILGVLTVLNLVLLMFLLIRLQPLRAEPPLGVLRGRELEIVDDAGKVRASIKVHPEDPKYKTDDGAPYPETVVLRLIAADGHPNVKLAANVRGAGLLLSGDNDGTMLLIKGEKDESSIKLTNKNGRARVLEP